MATDIVRFDDSELVIGLIGALGTDLQRTCDFLSEKLRVHRYEVNTISISEDVIRLLTPETLPTAPEYDRVSELMSAGNAIRRESGDAGVLALGAIARIAAARRARPDGAPDYLPRHAHIIMSLKHPEEVARFREVYQDGFYLIGVQASEETRRDHLIERRSMTPEQAEALMSRDARECAPNGDVDIFGQSVSKAFHLSDFFVLNDSDESLRAHVYRVLDVMFGHPYITPTFDEHAMFLAFAASLRSADLSRQVGAVIARDHQIIATGANDAPAPGGGLYWPTVDEDGRVSDHDKGRDYMREAGDPNRLEQDRIIEEIVTSGVERGFDRTALTDLLNESRIRSLTEYVRSVHAEMEALLAAARLGVSTRGAVLYSTTFPCHNCAKHIIAAGIARVVFIEPYPKSKAFEFHDDAITAGRADERPGGLVVFRPFHGVGPRRFFDLFSTNLGSGHPIRRKTDTGQRVDWSPAQSRLRLQLRPLSYIELEKSAVDENERLVLNDDLDRTGGPH